MWVVHPVTTVTTLPSSLTGKFEKRKSNEAVGQLHRDVAVYIGC